jgi:hypothetical protein
MDDAMIRARAAAAAARDVPPGHRLVAVEDTRWRLVTGKRCRDGAGGGGHMACGRPSVAEFNRDWSGKRPQGNYWAYCERHLFNRWIEDGQVMHWILREVTDAS